MTYEYDAWILGVACDALRPDPYMTVSEWADNYRILSEKTSAEPGQWRTDRVPYMREIMDALSPSSPYEEVDFMKGSQIAGSECGFNFLGYIIDQAPGPTLAVMPTVDTMKDNSKTRIEPMIEDCPRLRDKICESKSRDSSNTIMMKVFHGGFLSMVGANSPVGFRSKPCRYGFADEIDGYPYDVGDEGDALYLFRRAFRNFPNRKLFVISTPTSEGRSRITEAYDTTDRRRFYVSCLHCGEFQVLKWSQVKWPDNHPEAAFYVCEFCGGILQNHDKTEMLARGQWRADVPDYRGKRIGFHLSALYSPVGWFSWGEAAVQFVEFSHSKDESKQKQWTNTVLGEPWRVKGAVPDWERLYTRRERYEKGSVPGGGLVLTAGADIQKDRIEVEVVAWGRDKESWSVDFRVFPGDTADINSQCYKSLDMLMTEAFPHKSGINLYVRCLGIDSGYNTQIVYNWARRYSADRVIPMKGIDSLPMALGQARAVDVYRDGRRLKKGIKLWNVGVGHLKGELYGWLRLDRPAEDEPMPAGYAHFPEDYPEEYFRQLCAEELIPHQSKTTHQIRYEWVKIRDRNEALDCRVYARAAAAMLQLDRFQQHHWDQLTAAIWGTVEQPETRAPSESRTESAPQNQQPAAAFNFSRTRVSKRQVRSSGVRL